jgi:hypothetical protein
MMADDNLHIIRPTPISNNNILEKDNICECSDTKKLELYELKLELKSCREIIRILQEEARNSKSTPRVTCDVKSGELTEKTQINPWHQVGGWQNSSNQRRRPQKIRRQLQQLPLHTTNKF